MMSLMQSFQITAFATTLHYTVVKAYQHFRLDRVDHVRDAVGGIQHRIRLLPALQGAPLTLLPALQLVRRPPSQLRDYVLYNQCIV